MDLESTASPVTQVREPRPTSHIVDVDVLRLELPEIDKTRRFERCSSDDRRSVMIVVDMETTEPHRSNQRADGSGTSNGHPTPPRWLGATLWLGRVLLVVTVLAMLVSRLTRPWWISEGLDANGFAISWLPNVTLILVMATTILGQWLCGLATSPEAAWREGDVLVASTVVGRRRVLVPGSLVLPFRVFGRGGTVHGALLIDRRMRPLVLVGPISVGGRSRIDHLIGRASRGGFLHAFLEYFAGTVWLILVCFVAFLMFGLAGWFTGAFS
jgi:hypothetical protein